MKGKKFSSKDIATYYDVSEDHYMYFWDLNHSHALHYGYWDKTTRTFRASLENMNRVLSNVASIKSNMRVLDAGCGVGGSSIWLAKNKNVHVTGISLSAKQVNKANGIASKLGLKNLATFQVQDFTKTCFEDNSFDIVWAIESICHAEDKSKFIAEAYRILKKGGQLIMADFFIVKDGSAKDHEELDKWAHGWAVPFFEKKEVFENALIQNTFDNIAFIDSTSNIVKSAKRLYYAFFPGWVISKVYNLFNSKTTEFSKNNVYTAYYQYTTLKKGLWKYYIVKAIK